MTCKSIEEEVGRLTNTTLSQHIVMTRQVTSRRGWADYLFIEQKEQEIL